MKEPTLIDVELCNRLFEYKNGKLIRKIKTTTKTMVGEVAGNTERNGRRRVQIDNQPFLVSRIIYAMHYGDPAEKHIDHINHDPADDRIENLRLVTHKENSRNRSQRSNNTSGITGVHWKKSHKKWAVQIKVNGKNINCGYFKSLRAAAVERKYQEIKHGFHENHGA